MWFNVKRLMYSITTSLRRNMSATIIQRGLKDPGVRWIGAGNDSCMHWSPNDDLLRLDCFYIGESSAIREPTIHH